MKKKKNNPDINQKHWEKYIQNPQDIFDKETNQSPKNLKKKRYKFDLHGYGLTEANHRVKSIISRCIELNYSEILLITGKGIHSNTDKNTYVSKDLSKLRYSIPDFIASETELSSKIISISNADHKDGGAGALIIKLKKL